MGWMGAVSSLLKNYEGGASQQTATQDFQQVAQHAPPSAISGGLADAFRSDQTPPFGQMVSQMFSQSNGDQRAGILNHLLAAAGPGALSGGLLGSLGSMLGGSTQVTPQQAQQVSPEAVQHLAEHAQQQDPSIIDRASEFYAQHPTLVQGLGAGALALIMSRMSQR
jgi:hypothetical protein